MSGTIPPLSFSQRKAFEKLVITAQSVSLSLLAGGTGSGKTTILRHLHQRLGGHFISASDALNAIGMLHPHAMDEAIRRLLRESMQRYDLVIFDDYQVIRSVAMATEANPRPLLFDLVAKAVLDVARDSKKRLVAIASYLDLESVKAQGVEITLSDFVPEDYHDILRFLLGEGNTAGLDTAQIFHYTKKLNVYHMEQVVGVLRTMGITQPTTEEFLTTLQQHILRSNLDVREVEAVSSEQLRGTDELFEQLEKFIILPLREPELANKLGLKMKRGVLLHGAPGTGKTSIGRMLAHKMKGKFFMIDGSTNSDEGTFFASVNEIFARARVNSPSVIFIDDADLLFSAKGVHSGFVRYLLTKLDGLESASMGSVCLMMTAMDLRDMPAAIIRSGRVEVWLETKLPNLTTRREILSFYTKDLAQDEPVDVEVLAKKTEGFTPADLRRVAVDARTFRAYDVRKKKQHKSVNEYLVIATENLRSLKAKFSVSESDVA